MGVSRTRSKSFKRATEENDVEKSDRDDQDQPIEASVPKTSQKVRQGTEDIWDVGAVYSTDKIMPKKPIVTYSKKKYKARPELSSLLTSFHAKGSNQPKRADANHQVSNSSSLKEIKELQSRTLSTGDASNAATLAATTAILPRNDKQPETLIRSTQNDTDHIDQDHDNIIVDIDNDDATGASSSVAAGKQKAAVGKKSASSKKSLSISRTRREKRMEMDQNEGLQEPVDIQSSSKRTASHLDSGEMDHTKTPQQAKVNQYEKAQDSETPQADEAGFGFERLQDSLDRLNLSPIGNINPVTKRIVSSTPVGFRIQQQRHVSKPMKSFSESLKQANIDIEDKILDDNDNMTDDIATSVFTDKVPETYLQAPVSPPTGLDGGDTLSQALPDNNTLAPASATSEVLPQPTNTLPNLKEQRKAIEASIAEPSLHDASNEPIWSPPRSPSIEMARRQSQRSDTQNTIPEGLFEWFGNSIQSQVASTEPNHNVDEELENFLTPEQLDMTVEQFMRSIYEDKIEQIRKEGQKRIDRLNEELARVRAKLLAELDS
ncbi:hypothetical protein K450DRAFT_243683 [Umbelopsis ramanniana AG]|uniref:Uncharacterized protein n=1 Tax=Umbelopsis ramanniana AG TaxID=1314678 RepID=A0AAD5E9C1_UMBRA|nr:uncharacterized protein K450DRAFT_243683 [Umbelopsis ramanniana AG]KAI8579064.1 hypothetical protein K450DRAFT_243683 [Umbelopsis ramanniana AG]